MKNRIEFIERWREIELEVQRINKNAVSDSLNKKKLILFIDPEPPDIIWSNKN